MSQGLAIVGYGKMGKLIERLAPEYGFEVRAKFSGANNSSAQGLSHETLRGSDVAVEFTTPEAAPVNIRRLAVLGVRSVVGTTGWSEHLPAVREAVVHGKTGRCLGRELFGRRESFSANGCASRRSFRQAFGLRSMGLGNPSFRKKRRAQRHAEKACGRNARCRFRAACQPKLQSRRSNTRHSRNWFRFRRGHHHAAPHGAQPRRIRPRRSAGGPLDRRQKRFLRVQGDPRRIDLKALRGGAS